MWILEVAIPAFAIIVALVLIGIFFSRVYKKAKQDTAFVRTGLGGAKVIVEGGAIVLPVLHGIAEVSLKTHKLDVSRRQQEALITKDLLRADVTVEFFVRVMKETESIKIAAQTLGSLTNDPAELRRLVEGKFVDALRSVAATMELSELHQNRTDFVQRVRSASSEDLLKNGLELESASLVALDQTDQKYFNPSNSFDAAGLAKIAEITEEKRRYRFEIEQSTAVAIAERERETTKRTLDIDLETQQATVEQEKRIAQAKAERDSYVAERNSESRQTAERARISADRQIEEAEIQRIAGVEIARQQSEIDVARKSEEKSAAEAKAHAARQEAVAAEQQVETAKAVEIADRDRQVEVLEARKVAERAAIGVTVAAGAERESASVRAEAIQSLADAEANAEITRAKARAEAYRVDAAGTEALNKAHNIKAQNIIDMDIRLRLIEVLPDVVEHTVRPLENIKSIKVVDVSGLHGSGGAVAGANGDRSASLPEQVVSAALKHRVAAPLIDGIMRQVGLNGVDPNAIIEHMAGGLSADTKDETTPEAAPPAVVNDPVSAESDPMRTLGRHAG